MISIRTPLRITFVGGGTDFPEFFNQNPGCVVGASIDKYVYFNLLSLPKFAEQNFRFTYRTTESVHSFHDFSHPVIREILVDRNSQLPLNMGTMSDIPGNSGLGSSSSFSVAAITAFNVFDGHTTDPHVVARKAIWLEREKLQEEGGWQDQYQAAFGGLRCYTFTQNGVNVSNSLVPASVYESLDANFILVKVGSSRNSVLHSRKTRGLILDNKIQNDLMELAALAKSCEMEIAHSSSDSPAVLEILAKYTNLGWGLKKAYNPEAIPDEVNDLIEYGRKNGALAGRLCGAGGSGFVLFMVAKGKWQELLNALPLERTVPIRITSLGTEVIYDSNLREKAGY